MHGGGGVFQTKNYPKNVYITRGNMVGAVTFK
jgi:hypothetical protein